MRINSSLTLSKSSPLFAILIAMFMTNTSINEANAFTGGEVANDMNVKERGTYLAGITDGLAQARWLKDKPDQTGYLCTLNWFYKADDASQKRMLSWFARHPDKPASALLNVLIKKDCGS